jgi:hypothetical protein
VVRDEHHHLIVRPCGHDTTQKQRATGEIKDTRRELGHALSQFELRRVRLPCVFDPDLTDLVDHLRRLTASRYDSRSQCLVSMDESGNRALECIPVERAAQSHGESYVVRWRCAFKLLQKPEPLLGE